MVKTTKRKKHEKDIEQKVTKAQGIIQGLAIIALVTIMVADFYTRDTSVEAWVKGGLLAVAIGLSPKQVMDLVGRVLGAKK